MSAGRRVPPLLSLLLVLAALLTVAAALRCARDADCGDGGVCDRQMRCCQVRGCQHRCPAGQACLASGWPRCGKFSKFADTCACPRKLGCAPLPAFLPELSFLLPEPRPAQLRQGRQQLRRRLEPLGAPGPRRQQQPPETPPPPEQPPQHREWLDIFYDIQ